jgi:hypothetical protein
MILIGHYTLHNISKCNDQRFEVTGQATEMEKVVKNPVK